MKTRNSLVSNSSSSSFIVIGLPIEISQLNKTHINVNTSEFHTVILGKYLGEGQDVFVLHEEAQLKFIQDYPSLFDRAFTSAKYLYEAEGGIELKKILAAVGDQSDKLIIIGGTADQSSSYNIKQMIMNYQSNIEEELHNIAKKQFNERYEIKENDC
jgi:hypothetical protein